MFSGRVCVITGAANGIGRSVAEAFCKEGATIAFIDKDRTAGEKLLSHLNTIGENNLFYHGDIGEKSALEDFSRSVIEKYQRVDFLINNACISYKGILSGCSYEEFNLVLSIGVTAPYYLSYLFKDFFSNIASIVNISSTRSQMSQKDTESYSAAKGGISSLTHALAMSLSGIARVNSISPGWIDTHQDTYISGADKIQHPSQRVGLPGDIARVVIFLCNQDSSFINGEDIVIDGGMSRRMIYHGEDAWRLITHNEGDKNDKH